MMSLGWSEANGTHLLGRRWWSLDTDVCRRRTVPRYMGKAATCWQLAPGHPASRSARQLFLPFKPPGLWCFVRVVIENWFSILKITSLAVFACGLFIALNYLGFQPNYCIILNMWDVPKKNLVENQENVNHLRVWDLGLLYFCCFVIFKHFPNFL